MRCVVLKQFPTPVEVSAGLPHMPTPRIRSTARFPAGNAGIVYISVLDFARYVSPSRPCIKSHGTELSDF